MANRPPTMKSFVGMTVIGLFAGFLVGMTSVGSGSIIMMLLLLFYSYPPKVMVGTDIVHAVLLTGMTSLLHYRAGQRRSYVWWRTADRLDSRRAAGYALEHTRSDAMAAPHSVCSSSDHRRPNAVGLIQF